MLSDLNILAAFAGGLVSFLAPCVLPIIPGFLAYLSGVSVKEGGAHRKEVFLNSLFFVLGFSIVFAALGVLLQTALESISYDVQIWLARIGGLIIILFGFYLAGLLHIPAFEREFKVGVKAQFKSRYLTSFLFGLAFAAGWTPCVGPVLGAILNLAVTAPATTFYLLLAYSLGLGLPFLITGLFVSQVSNWIAKYASILRYVNVVFGIILIALGVLVFTQELAKIANFEFLNNILLKQQP